jgi:hypothetical protein
MSATNRRVRRAILDILWDEGPLTKEEVANELANRKGVGRVPSPHSLSALLCKSNSVISVGKKTVQNIVGVKAKHLLYDIDREIVLTKDEIKYIREPSTLTPKEKALSAKCPHCSRTRIFPEGSTQCLSCLRSSGE